MDALDALHNRTSVPKLTAPAPSDAQLHSLFRAAQRAADHGMLQPWRFLVIEGEALTRLGDLFAAATLEDDPATTADMVASARSKALRAPMIIVAICRPQPVDKVPALEQHMAVAAACQNLLTAAFALGIGAIWRTGPMASHPRVTAGLGLTEEESIVAFLYLGTPGGPHRRLDPPDPLHCVQHWTGAPTP